MLRLSGIKLPVGTDFSDPAAICAKYLQTARERVTFAELKKRSLDARRKNDIHWVCTIDFKISGDERRFISKDRNKLLRFAGDRNFSDDTLLNPKAVIGSRPKVLITGAGPAGLFCALRLAESGFSPILIERGRSVDERVKTVNRFWTDGRLDPECNVQFGEGGAGTFSDGKLTTGIKDPRCRFVLETFSRFGAGEEILYDAKPHIGSDRLVGTVKNIRREIERLGGRVRFSTRLADIVIKDGRICKALLESGRQTEEESCDALVIAPGHSARDTFEMLLRRGAVLVQKPFAMGVRIEHPQALIDRGQYGVLHGQAKLPPADYKLSVHLPDGRGVYTFCMCPGGEVVAAASELGGVCTNGMSLSARDGKNANSALLVGITPQDFQSDHPLAGVELQRTVERAAFKAAGGDYRAPACLLGNLLEQTEPNGFGEVEPSYRPGVTPVPLSEYMPEFIQTALRNGIPQLAKRLSGFDMHDAVLTGPEARSSSPVRILRDENYQASVKGLFPCGEGAGYAGGIMSAAVDGLRVADAIIRGAL